MNRTEKFMRKAPMLLLAGMLLVAGCAGGPLTTREKAVFFQAEDGIRDYKVTGVQACALPILMETPCSARTAPYPASIPEILRSSAKVGLLHFRVPDDVGRRALADDPAGVEADHALREAHHRLHDVLDHDDRDPRRIQGK